MAEDAAMVHMDAELSRMPSNLTGAWTEAQQKCPQLVGYSHKLMFLRCERFHGQLAALRLVRYWSKRLELFGPEGAFLSLSTLAEGKSAMRIHAVDMETLQLGFLQWTGQCDEEGRGILFVEWAKIPPGYSRGRRKRSLRLPSLCRVLWFIAHVALEESDSVQTNGMVAVSEGRGWNLRHLDLAQSTALVETMTGCLPLRLVEVHGCHAPLCYKWIIFPFLVRRRMRDIMLDASTSFYIGSGRRLLKKLAERGLPLERLPTQVGGLLELRYREWLQEMRDRGTTDNDDNEGETPTEEEEEEHWHEKDEGIRRQNHLTYREQAPE